MLQDMILTAGMRLDVSFDLPLLTKRLVPPIAPFPEAKVSSLFSQCRDVAILCVLLQLYGIVKCLPTEVRIPIGARFQPLTNSGLRRRGFSLSVGLRNVMRRYKVLAVEVLFQITNSMSFGIA